SNAFVNILIAKFKTVPVADQKLDMVMPRYYLRKNSKELAWSFCNLIRVTLRDNGHLDTASLAMLIRAIPWHNMDGPKVKFERRIQLHYLCSPKTCTFKQSRDKESFIPSKPGSLNHVPRAIQRAVVHCFKNDIAKVDVLERTRRGLNQNANESVHQRLYIITPKEKFIRKARLEWCASYVATEHNFGRLGASLLPAIGDMSEADIARLKHLDDECMRTVLRPPRKDKMRLNEKSNSYSYGFGFEDVDSPPNSASQEANAEADPPVDQNANTEGSGEADADFDFDINVNDDDTDEQDNITAVCYDNIDNLTDNENEDLAE
ncbi:unnamed protein product, partial [Meganyctiphanes norvegica]